MIEEFGAVVGGEHYLAALLILILSCILTSRSILSERVNQGSFWITLFVCTLLIIQDVLENVAQLDPARRDLRMITSIAGYTLGECLLCAGVTLTAFSLAECFFRGFDSFGVIVREARLDRMLLRPRGLVMQVLCERIELSRVGRLVQGLFMLVWGVRLAPVPFTAYHYLVLSLMSVCGAALFSALFVMPETLTL